MDKFNKLLLPVVILLGCIILGGFIYASQLSKQKSIEKQQQVEIEQEKQDQLSKEQKEQQTKGETMQALNDCIASAEDNYHTNWIRECKVRGLLSNECISLQDMTFDEYAKQNNISTDTGIGWLKAESDFYEKQYECSCSLPLDLADNIDESLQNDEDNCFKKYPQ